VRLWPLKRPKTGEKDNDAWTSARAAARTSVTIETNDNCGRTRFLDQTLHGRH